MKTKHLELAILISLFFVMIGCTDDNTIIPTKVENKTLAVTDTVCLMFKSMNGSGEGGIEGIETGKYKERHLIWMNQLPFVFGKRAMGSSMTFIGETDSVEITGHINCSYNDDGYMLYTSAIKKKFKFKFENNALKILLYPDRENWVTVGYGNKEKIEVYIESKCMHVGAMPIYPDQIVEGAEDKYVWEIEGTSHFDTNISITPELAKATMERENWQDFFDEVRYDWVYMIAGKYYADMFQKPQDMKHKYQGATWSIYKMTYLPKTTAN